MVINTNKTVCMTLGPQKRLIKFKYSSLTVNGVYLKSVQSHNLLGIYLDKHLTYYLCKKVSIKSICLKKNHLYLSLEMKKPFDTGYIPIMEYGCTI